MKKNNISGCHFLFLPLALFAQYQTRLQWVPRKKKNSFLLLFLLHEAQVHGVNLNRYLLLLFLLPRTLSHSENRNRNKGGVEKGATKSV